MSKTNNASRNIFFGVLLRIYQIAFPFAMRTIMVYTIGIQYLGLNSLFGSVLSVLNLAELGVGSAMIFSMYKPIAENDSVSICALMRLYQLYYRVIGGVVLVLGLCLLPFIDRLITGGVPDNINIYLLYLLNLLTTVFSYWLFAYRNSILYAHQRTDIYSRTTLVTDTGKYLLQITILMFLRNYYLFVICALLSQMCTNVIIAICSKKMYPQYQPKGKLPAEEVKKINGKIRDLFTSKLGYTIVHSADTIVISSFLGLTVLAQYQNYYFIMSSIVGFVAIIYSSIMAAVGNSIITKGIDDNYKEFEILSILVTWVCGVCCSCFMVLYQPVMRLWMGEENLLGIGIVILLCLYFWLYELLMMFSMYKDAGGIWHEDRFRPLISGIANLAINIILVQFIGIYGIVISTVASMLFISLPWIIRNVFVLLFQRSPVHFLRKLSGYTLKIVITVALVYGICNYLPNYNLLAVAIEAIICGLLSAGVLALLLRRDPLFKPAWEVMLSVSKINRLKAVFRRAG